MPPTTRNFTSASGACEPTSRPESQQVWYFLEECAMQCPCPTLLHSYPCPTVLHPEPPTEFICPPQPVKKCIYTTVYKAEPTPEVIIPQQPVKKCTTSTVYKAEPTAEVIVTSQPVKECSSSSECSLSSKSAKNLSNSIEEEELIDGLQALFKVFLSMKSA
ncbi:unnamed protein product [Taenia asiatica]|uniref:Keratinocyte proline-rich protein-like n=1 Tax=Taenia asiatica TaxID=60517 RepID=A0A0R3VWF0_TAEAS|nr:unnamed protein product [Taenia asiatica]